MSKIDPMSFQQQGDCIKNPALPVAVVEDEPLFRELLAEALDRDGSCVVVGRYGDAESALAEIPELAPRVAVLDIELGSGLSGIELGVELRRQLPELGILLLSHHRVPSLMDAIPAEAMGGWSYLLKRSVRNLEVLRRAVQGAADGLVVLDRALLQADRAHTPEAGGPLERLSPRQHQILQLMAEGWSNQGIAQQLSLSLKSIENQVNLIYQELAIDRRGGLVQPRVQAVLAYLKGLESM